MTARPAVQVGTPADVTCSLIAYSRHSPYHYFRIKRAFINSLCRNESLTTDGEHTDCN